MFWILAILFGCPAMMLWASFLINWTLGWFSILTATISTFIAAFSIGVINAGSWANAMAFFGA